MHCTNWCYFFFFQAEDGIRDVAVTGVQTCALPIFALPSTKAARLAIRTQQVIANESDLTATADPFAGSYAIESMTDDIEAAAESLIDRIEEMGGAAAAIELGFQKAEIEAAAYQVARG